MIPTLPTFWPRDAHERDHLLLQVTDLPLVVFHLIQSRDETESTWYRNLALALCRRAGIEGTTLEHALLCTPVSHKTIERAARSARHPWLSTPRLWTAFRDLAALPFRWTNHLEGPWFYRLYDRSTAAAMPAEVERRADAAKQAIFDHTEGSLAVLETTAEALILAWGGNTAALASASIPIHQLIKEPPDEHQNI